MLRPAAFTIALTAASFAGLLALTTAAEAKRHKAPGARALTVKKRPFTDSGNVVYVGSQSNYVRDGQSNNRPFNTIPAGIYSSDVLPRRWDVPGAGPLFNF